MTIKVLAVVAALLTAACAKPPPQEPARPAPPVLAELPPPEPLPLPPERDLEQVRNMLYGSLKAVDRVIEDAIADGVSPEWLAGKRAELVAKIEEVLESLRKDQEERRRSRQPSER